MPRPNKPELERVEDASPRGGEATEEAVKAGVETKLEAPGNEDDASKYPLGAIVIGDYSSFPPVSDSMIRDTQAADTSHGEGAYEDEDFFRGYFAHVEDITGLGDLDVLRKSSNEASSSYTLTNQFPPPSVYPDSKKPLIISIPEDT